SLPSGAAAQALAGARGEPASPEQLAADRAAVEAADAALTEARQNREQAVLVSPIDGTVGALDLQVGDTVVGGSPAPQVVVVAASRGYQLEVPVDEGDIARVAVGNPVTVTPDGSGDAIEGSVAAVGLLPAGSTGSAVTYEVTIALPGATGPFPAGQGASVAIRLADVTGVLTVPTSAVHTDGATSAVAVLRGDAVEPVPVRVGAVGPVRTEILSGLAAGDEVVIADPSRPLPTPGLTNLGGLRSGSRSQGGG
ncbi:efflux RND transporter periplasmic adaptor subunit, partial [Pseudonocardia lacus]|uniref:efflux RND transporter periplasmic adaptor subunit n=1 Tax=Pseudonocardia lacus TaxID=2835865 RepID=UPI001BDC0561